MKTIADLVARVVRRVQRAHYVRVTIVGRVPVCVMIDGKVIVRRAPWVMTKL